MTLFELRRLEADYQLQGLPHYPICAARGEGSTLYDNEGAASLDFSGAMGRTCIGYDNSTWIDALMDQLLKLSCAAEQFVSEPIARLAAELCYRSGFSKACFSSSGVEAQRLMYALARAHSRARYDDEARRIILSLQSSQAPLSTDMRAVAADMDALRAAASPDVCAVRLELLPIDGDMNPLSRQFVHDLTVFCAEQNWLILLDERSSGAGRTGTLFLFEQYGVSPDMLLFSESISAGLPFGGVLFSHRCDALSLADVSDELSSGTTPLCAAAALSVLELLNEDVLAAAKEKGDYLRQGIQALQLPVFSDVGGVGLMVSLPCTAAVEPLALSFHLAECGLITLPTTCGLLLIPPLTVSKNELRSALALLENALSKGERLP